jgi:CDP-diacylglycerol--glycerol-3-phosphate 3-phosphatidyltransferase
VFRIVLVPVFIFAYFSDSGNAKIYATGIYLLAAATDFLDGRIARKYNLVSKLGRILDPLGDKLMTFAVLICITIERLVPGWAVVIFFIKEMLMAVGGLLIYNRLTDMPSSNYFGKCATVVFVIVCAMLMLFKNIPKIYATAMIAFAIIVMLVAFISYLIQYVKIIRSQKRTGTN